MYLKPIVALDLSEPSEALQLVSLLRPQIDFFKVGSQLFLAGGADVVRKIIDSGADVFLDLKFHDIPKTVFRAVREAVKLKVKFTTVHIFGGRAMLKEALEAASGSYTEVLGVTVLTSMDSSELESLGVVHPLEEEVLLLTRLALDAGLRGIVCSGRELPALSKMEKRASIVVVPGIRWKGTAHYDQKRTIEPKEAKQWGATHIVVGRPLLDAVDKVGLVRKLLCELNEIN
ncbi:orotidine-5'-phosphate decarboxylase [Methylacidiphilum caldifontis]|uniref:Orotidine 5'-phosphate decarboxylase n=1 Tax=Methylacidiphilum caldifontis TaxID=2795386 RepID=A0A4Y8P6T7_9BACT|nr:orotidine-5'-phosphate decarboxylase [Methylacidiphilum caldifontis]QSR88815.1 orotidine-5'-phosphate decarboxylase [Methylacidiphilum caldifontis]TFE65886.1 orotidine 5'-phosphate decarboxylase [Methylacidiphilum caldifontis]